MVWLVCLRKAASGRMETDIISIVKRMSEIDDHDRSDMSVTKEIMIMGIFKQFRKFGSLGMNTGIIINNVRCLPQQRSRVI